MVCPRYDSSPIVDQKHRNQGAMEHLVHYYTSGPATLPLRSSVFVQGDHRGQDVSMSDFFVVYELPIGPSMNLATLLPLLRGEVVVRQ